MLLGFVGSIPVGPRFGGCRRVESRVGRRRRVSVCLQQEEKRPDGGIGAGSEQGNESGLKLWMEPLKSWQREKCLEKLVNSATTDMIEMSDQGSRMNVISMRAIADVSASSIVYELGSSLYCCSCLVTQIQSAFSEQFLQLFAGAALGVWTISTTLRSMIYQELSEEKKIREKIGSEAKHIAKEWETYINSVDGILDLSPVVYEGSSDVESAEDLDFAVTWLVSMDEIEGMGTQRLMDKFAHHPDKDMRLQLVKSLFDLSYSNRVVALLQIMKEDGCPEVANEAALAWARLLELGVVAEESETALVPAVTRELTVEETRSTLSRIFAKSSYIESALGAVTASSVHEWHCIPCFRAHMEKFVLEPYKLDRYNGHFAKRLRSEFQRLTTAVGIINARDVSEGVL